MRKAIFVFLGFALAILFGTSDFATAQEELKFKLLKPEAGLTTLFTVYGIKALDTRHALAIVDASEGSASSLFAVKLKRNGKIVSKEQIGDPTGTNAVPVIVWPDFSDGSLAAAEGEAFCFLLFPAFQEPTNPRNPLYKLFTVHSLPIDRDGNTLGNPELVLEYKASAQPYIEDWPFTLYAAPGPDSVGIACAVGIRDVTKSMKAYFLELDSSGKRIGSQQSIELPNDGRSMNLWLSRPHANDGDWLIPGRARQFVDAEKDVIVSIIGPSGVASSPVPPDAFKSNVITEKLWTYGDEFQYGHNLQYLPYDAVASTPASAAAGDSCLLVQRQKFKKLGKERYLRHVHKIDEQGVGGRSKKLKLPKRWKPDIQLGEHQERFQLLENFGPSILTDDGRTLLPLLRDLVIKDSVSNPYMITWTYWSQISILSVDPDTGNVETLYSCTSDFDGRLSLRGFDLGCGRLWIVVSAYSPGGTTVDPLYISATRFK